MACCDTRYFGPAEYAETDVIAFPSGLPGFPEQKTFLVLQRAEEYPLAYLQSTSTADVCFLTMPILAVDNQYALSLSAEEASLLGTVEEPRIGQDVLCLALVAVRESGPTANLLAPVVINLATHTGAQCFNKARDYSHRFPLLAQEEVAA